MENKPTQVSYCQVVEGSHQFTLYGLKQELIKLKGELERGFPNSGKNITEYILTGIENSIKDDKEILPNIYHRFGPIPTEILREGVEVFGTEQEFKEWLDKPNAFLNFKKPSELSDRDILDELARIKNGIL